MSYIYPEPHPCTSKCHHDERLMELLGWLDQPAVREADDQMPSHTDLLLAFEGGWDFEGGAGGPRLLADADG